MGWFGSWFGAGGSGGSSAPAFPALANATTVDKIRDRMLTVIEGLTPVVLVGDKFRRYRGEGDGNFQTWAEANATASFRRFDVREVEGYATPPVSNTDSEERMCTIRILVAYPQTGRTGARASFDRLTTMSRDQDIIELAVGMCGRANFSGAFPDACWRSRRQDSPIVGAGVDFVVITQTMSFRWQREQ